MQYIQVGKIVNTHALKGELRIVSNFEFKNQVFNVGNKLYIGRFKTEEAIETYRKHKNYDMVKFTNKGYIGDVLPYKGDPVYILKESIKLGEDELLESDMLEMEIILNDKVIGKIEEYRNDNGNKLIMVNDKYIPYNKDFIDKIDKQNKKIYYKGIEGLL
jgi:16S rRNA processing protein RimM